MSKFKFDKVLQNMEKVKKTLPPVVANLSVNFFVASFNNQGFTDGSLSRWQARKNDTRPGRAILVKSGALKRAVSGSVKEATWDKIHLVIDSGAVPYAKRHNEGLDGMPKRQFMGQSHELQKQQVSKIKQVINSIWLV
jgi:phage gpG-like protein